MGVIFNTDLNFHTHIEIICCKALKALGFIIRVSKKCNLSSPLKTIHYSLVHSIIEYGSVLWDPYTVTDSCQLERVQWRFLSSAAFILKINHPPHDYSNHAGSLFLIIGGWPVNANFEFLCKLVNSSVDAPSLLSLVNFKVSSHTTRYSIPHVVSAHTNNYGQNNSLDRLMR